MLKSSHHVRFDINVDASDLQSDDEERNNEMYKINTGVDASDLQNDDEERNNETYKIDTDVDASDLQNDDEEWNNEMSCVTQAAWEQCKEEKMMHSICGMP